RHVHEGHERDVEAVAEAHEPGGFVRRVDVQHAGQHDGLLGHDAHRLPPQAGEADHDVPREMLLDLQELAVIHHFGYDLLHVVPPGGHVRHDGVEVVV